MGLDPILNLLKPAAHLPEITDPLRVKKEFRYWRLRIFYSMYIGYLFYYFTRRSLACITPLLLDDLKITMVNIGWMGTTLSIAYGVSKFTSGVLCDRSNPRYFMAIGLILTGVCNIIFGFFSSVIFLCLFWGLNGLFQGWGWPACTKQLTHWFSQSERGTWWSICSTSYVIGGSLIGFLAPPIAKVYGWRFGMFVPGILCILAGFWLLNRLRDVPQSLGLPPVEQYRGESLKESEKDKEEGQVMSFKQILFEQVLNNKYVWILAFSYFFIYFLRTAVDQWGNLYLIRVKEYSLIQANACVSLFEAGGFVGILLAGLSSDFLFQGRRIPLTVISSFLLTFAVMGFWSFTSGSMIQGFILSFIIGSFVFIPQMLVGLAAAEFVNKKAAGASNGFVSCLAHVGAASAGGPLAYVIEHFGWYGFIVTLVVCSLVTFMVLLPIWSVQNKVSDEVKASDEIKEQDIISVEDMANTAGTGELAKEIE